MSSRVVGRASRRKGRHYDGYPGKSGRKSVWFDDEPESPPHPQPAEPDDRRDAKGPPEYRPAPENAPDALLRILAGEDPA